MVSSCSISPRIRSGFLRSESRNTNSMPDSQFAEDMARPTVCPFCKGKIIDTLAGHHRDYNLTWPRMGSMWDYPEPESVSTRFR